MTFSPEDIRNACNDESTKIIQYLNELSEKQNKDELFDRIFLVLDFIIAVLSLIVAIIK